VIFKPCIDEDTGDGFTMKIENLWIVLIAGVFRGDGVGVMRC